MKKHLFSIIMVSAFMTTLNGCGQDGPLCLPEQKEAAPVIDIPESAADAELTQDDLSQQDWD